MFVVDTGMSSFLSDGPVSMPNMPNQIMNRMQVPQGMFLFFVLVRNTTFSNNIPNLKCFTNLNIYIYTELLKKDVGKRFCNSCKIYFDL